MANALSPKHTFSPIQKEASTITSLFQQLKPAISILLEKGIKVVILTLGSKGVLLCSKKHFNFLHSICPKRNNNNKRLQEAINLVCPVGRFSGGGGGGVVHFPAVSLAAVVRLTGAGDCLVGGVVASVCGGLDLMQSVAVGIATAKAAVEVETNVPLQFDFDHIAGMFLLLMWHIKKEMLHFSWKNLDTYIVFYVCRGCKIGVLGCKGCFFSVYVVRPYIISNVE